MLVGAGIRRKHHQYRAVSASLHLQKILMEPIDLNRRVGFNVGGKVLETTVGTLTMGGDRFLEKLINHRIDKKGHIVLKKNVRTFRQILNFLRDGVIPIPDDADEFKELVKESRSLHLRSLTQYLVHEKVSQSRSFVRGDRVEFRDGNMQRVFQRLGVKFDGSTPAASLPVCFRPDQPGSTCDCCGTKTEEMGNEYRSLLSMPQNATNTVGIIRKVYPTGTCLDVSFAMFNYVYHIPCELLQHLDDC